MFFSFVYFAKSSTSQTDNNMSCLWGINKSTVCMLSFDKVSVGEVTGCAVCCALGQEFLIDPHTVSPVAADGGS